MVGVAQKTPRKTTNLVRVSTFCLSRYLLSLGCQLPDTCGGLDMYHQRASGRASVG